MGQFAVHESIGPPLSVERAVPIGTSIELDASLRTVGRGVVAGGSPWRLLRLSDASATLIESWRDGGIVRHGEGIFARTLLERGLLNVRPEPARDTDDVDVIVPFGGGLDALSEALRSLAGHHVTVVDDACDRPDDVVDVATSFGARVVRLAVRGGPATARNAGVAATGRPFIWFVDADVVVPEAVTIGRTLRGHFDDAMVAAVAARVVGLGGPSTRDRFEVRHGPLDLGPSSSLVVARGRVPYVPSACLMVRRAALGGGFDVSLRHGEDVDLVWRLNRAGWRVHHDARCVVRHRSRATWGEFVLQRVGYGSSAAALRDRHAESLDLVRVDAWTLVAWIAVLARRPRLAASVVLLSRRALMARLPTGQAEPGRVANAVVVRGVLGAGGPLARAVVRTYGPAVAALALGRRWRRPAILVLAAGTAWRWRRAGRIRLDELAPALADDAAYAAGVWLGAARGRRPSLLVPKITFSSTALSDAVLGGRRSRPPSRST
jgi:mycofactocin system glycosyltransferase